MALDALDTKGMIRYQCCDGSCHSRRDPNSVAMYLLTRTFNYTTYKWFSEWQDELLELYETLRDWCHKIGWDFTDRVDFHAFCAMVVKLTNATQPAKRRAWRRASQRAPVIHTPQFMLDPTLPRAVAPAEVEEHEDDEPEDEEEVDANNEKSPLSNISEHEEIEDAVDERATNTDNGNVVAVDI